VATAPTARVPVDEDGDDHRDQERAERDEQGDERFDATGGGDLENGDCHTTVQNTGWEKRLSVSTCVETRITGASLVDV
jgi:hypothetical protein